MKNELVSIIIPTFKRSDRIQRAIDSCLKQTYKNIEIIVVDDNDYDSIERELTSNKLQKYKDCPIVKYIKHEYNKNGAAARNTGIKNSNGNYLTFLDDDDELYPEKVMEQVSALKKLGDDWSLCYTGYDKLLTNGKILKSSEKVEGDVFIQAITKNLFVGSGSNIMIKRKLALKLKGFDETFQRNQDLEFLVRALQKSKIKFVDKSLFLIHYEVRERNFTFKELISINDNYRKKFSNIINSLSIKDKNKVNKILDLWDLRHAIEYKKFKEAWKIYKKSNLNPIDILYYAFHLMVRYVSKTSYGFKLK